MYKEGFALPIILLLVALTASAGFLFASSQGIIRLPTSLAVPVWDQAVLEKIGEPEDLPDNKTIFGKLNGVLVKVGSITSSIDLSSLATLANQTKIFSLIGSGTDSAGTTTVFSNLAKLNLNLDAAVSSRAPSSTALSNLTWTDTRAGYLDSAISSRAPSSTAVSNVYYTSSRAANLDSLDTSVSSRLPTSSYIAPDNSTIGAINTKLGLNTDTAGTTTAFARFAQINGQLPVDTGTVNTKIGTNTDPIGTTTLFAWFAKISDYLINTINATLGTINTKIGTNTDLAGTTTLFARLVQLFNSVGSTTDTASPTGTVNAKLAQVLANQAAPTGFISNVQYGSISMAIGTASATATITAVDTSKSVVVGLGNTASSTVGGEMSVAFTLTNSTTVTANRNSGGSTSVVGYFVVVTFTASFKSIQVVSGQIISNGTSVAIPITSVNTAKTLILPQGTLTGGSNDASEVMIGWTLTNSTTVTAFRNAVASATTNVYAVVVESN